MAQIRHPFWGVPDSGLSRSCPAPAPVGTPSSGNPQGTRGPPPRLAYTANYCSTYLWPVSVQTPAAAQQ
eukprot:6170079-Prorocentrum_lima.AAC.1